jgi:hypothetical protein
MAKFKDRGLVKALREHPLLGAGTESVIDQCFTDAEIMEELEREDIKTVAKAIQHFAIWEGLEVEDLIDAENDDDDDDEDPSWWHEWEEHADKHEY